MNARAITRSGSLHSERPSVYLDQWVWIRLARAALGRPDRAEDVDVLEEIRQASNDGVAFPLSTTHYVETARITDPRQRNDLVAVMAPISNCRTLRSSRVLLRHQFLEAMHETVGRPAFRPRRPEVLGLGVHWAFIGEQVQLRVYDQSGRVNEDNDAELRRWLRHANQYAQASLLAGPADEDVEELRAHGYAPEVVVDSTQSRVAWEGWLANRLKDGPPSRDELRVWLLARELTHEYLDLLNQLLAEYGLSMSTLAGGSADIPKVTRPRMVAFAERIPTLRIAAELKLEVFRNRQRSWTVNMLHDIDALSHVIPYCHVVVADRDAVDLLRRTRAHDRSGTAVVSQLSELRSLLPDLRAAARSLGGDPTGWDGIGPGVGFQLMKPPALRPSSAGFAEPEQSTLQPIDRASLRRCHWAVQGTESASRRRGGGRAST